MVAYWVSQRGHEFGIRVSLGAQPTDILKLVLRRSLLLALPGAVVGFAGALLLTRFLSSFLFGVGPTDLIAYGGATALLTLAALAACWAPARRAMRLDPIAALRSE